MSGKLVDAFRKCGPSCDPYVRTLVAGLSATPPMIPFRFGPFCVRKALAEEGPPGSLVVEVDELKGTRLLCTEAGPVIDSTGAMRKRSVRMPDAMWQELVRRGDPSSLIRDAVRAYLERA